MQSQIRDRGCSSQNVCRPIRASVCDLKLKFYETEVVAQPVRASVCGTEGRGFEPHLPPQRKGLLEKVSLFSFLAVL